MRRLVLLLTLVALASGCSRRDRDNPLDPANPRTEGRPVGFNAVAGNTSVLLSWTPQPGLEIDGYELQRKLPSDSNYVVISDDIPRDQDAFLDPGVVNGVTARYRLYYVLAGSPAKLPAEDLATPGRLRPWVTEYGTGRLLRLSPDTRDVAFTVSGVGDVEGLAVDAGDRIWCTARLQGWLTSLDPDGSQRIRVTGLSSPAEIAVSPTDASVWVSDVTGSVLHYGLDGLTHPPYSIGPFARAEGVAVSPLDLSVWVCDSQGNRVRRYTASGSIVANATVGQPIRVAVDSSTSIAWATSYALGRVWRIAPDGALIDSVSLGGPIGIAVDRVNERVWVADAFSGVAVAYDPATFAKLFTVAGLRGVRDVAVDRTTGDAWFTVTGLGAVVRIDKSGHEVARVSGLDTPAEVRLGGLTPPPPGAPRAAARRASQKL